MNLSKFQLMLQDFPLQVYYSRDPITRSVATNIIYNVEPQLEVKNLERKMRGPALRMRLAKSKTKRKSISHKYETWIPSWRTTAARELESHTG